MNLLATNVKNNRLEAMVTSDNEEVEKLPSTAFKESNLSLV